MKKQVTAIFICILVALFTTIGCENPSSVQETSSTGESTSEDESFETEPEAFLVINGKAILEDVFHYVGFDDLEDAPWKNFESAKKHGWVACTNEGAFHSGKEYLDAFLEETGNQRESYVRILVYNPNAYSSDLVWVLYDVFFDGEQFYFAEKTGSEIYYEHHGYQYFLQLDGSERYQNETMYCLSNTKSVSFDSYVNQYLSSDSPTKYDCRNMIRVRKTE